MVLMNSIGNGALCGLVLNCATIFLKKRLCPYTATLSLVGGGGLCTYYNHQRMLLKYNKRIFDMCNVGVEYELGYQRNEVLKQCNEIQGVEDF